MEQQLASGLGEGQIADFIKDDEVETVKVTVVRPCFPLRVCVSKQLTRSTTLKEWPRVRRDESTGDHNVCPRWPLRIRAKNWRPGIDTTRIVLSAIGYNVPIACIIGELQSPAVSSLPV
jgi:hypothetical protein